MKYTSPNRYSAWKFLILLASFTGVCLITLLYIYPSLYIQFVPSPKRPPSQGYYVSGNKIYNASNNEYIFKGVSRPSLEWSAKGDHLSLEDYKLMKSWGFNLVRLPLNQKYWLDDTEEYRARLAKNIHWIESLDMDVLLDLHWSDRGDSARDAAQQRMADDNSLTFWTEVATAYKNDGRVLFELYNEPHDISWNTWQYGGSSGDGFETVGMQDLYDAVRSAGAENLVIINGLDWAFDLSQVDTYAIQGYNIVYGTHIYDQPGKRTLADWERSLEKVMKKYPVIVSEFGNFDCDTSFYKSILSYAKTHRLAWVGWAWYPGGCGFPALISNWSGESNALGEELKKMLGTSP
jgi:hypothetical protein